MDSGGVTTARHGSRGNAASPSEDILAEQRTGRENHQRFWVSSVPPASPYCMFGIGGRGYRHRGAPLTRCGNRARARNEQTCQRVSGEQQAKPNHAHHSKTGSLRMQASEIGRRRRLWQSRSTILGSARSDCARPWSGTVGSAHGRRTFQTPQITQSRC